MPLSRVLPILCLLFGAWASSLDSRQPNAHPLDAHDVSDICSWVNSEFLVPDPHNIGHGTGSSAGVFDAGVIQSCLCLSGMPEFLENNSVGIAAVSAAGEDLATRFLTNLIKKFVDRSCNYPENSTPACIGGDPCGFTCSDGLTAYPTENPTMCGCPAPNIVCNGNCVAPGACPSSQVTLKRRWVGSGSCTEKGHGWAACGVFGRGARGWECVNTARDLESCGGCVPPLTPFSPIGQDCTALPGVADVSCLSGDCVIHRCMPGYALSRDGDSCISTQAHNSRPHVEMPEDEDEYMQAIRYGLLHRPF